MPLRKNPAKRVIYLYMSGGMTHLDTFDTKPGHENQGPVRELATNVPGVALSEYLPQLTNHADKMAIINSMTSTAGAHEQARYLMHTSYERRATISHPGIGAYMLKYQDKLNKDLPGSVFGQGCLLARRLIEHDVRAIEVSYGGWDTHQNNFVAVPERTSILDQAMAALLSDLERTGLLDSTLVVLATEFGRTPRINQNAGRDHYPKAFSCVLAGGGVNGGIKWGKTTPDGEDVDDKSMEPQDFNATIAYGLGIAVDRIVMSPSRRPFKVAHKGLPETSLFG